MSKNTKQQVNNEPIKLFAKNALYYAKFIKMYAEEIIEIERQSNLKINETGSDHEYPHDEVTKKFYEIWEHSHQALDHMDPDWMYDTGNENND